MIGGKNESLAVGSTGIMSIGLEMGIGYDIKHADGMFGQSMSTRAVQLQYRSCKQS